MIEITVIGLPQPAGSKKAFPIRRADGSVGVAVSDANPKAREWKALVLDAARQQHDGPPFTEALRLEITFNVPRPKSHFGTGRSSLILKRSAPKFPTGRPDCTKLVRGTEDALTGVLWRDDAQIVDQVISKRYGRAGATIRVELAE